MSILTEITDYKRANLPKNRQELTTDQLPALRAKHPPRLGFLRQLETHSPAVIAEIKRASPSKGVIRENYMPVEIARSYAAHNAACLSILTDEKYFGGCDSHLTDVRQDSRLPILRKDFIVDPSQLVESLELGADCVLLIVATLTQTELQSFHEIARELGLDVLIEVHDEHELDLALECDPLLIGINNRNLKTFETTIDTTFSLLPKIPQGVLVVSESGIHTSTQVDELRDAGVDTFLVGEAFMRQTNPGKALTELFGAIDVRTTHTA